MRLRRDCALKVQRGNVRLSFTAITAKSGNEILKCRRRLHLACVRRTQPLCGAPSGCLQTPNDVFKRNYQHNWRTLFVLLFTQSLK